jgi:hypothetical protein
MNPVIEKLVLQIAYICLHITAQGKWHAHFGISAHCRTLNVYVWPSTRNYVDGESGTPALSRFISYQAKPRAAENAAAPVSELAYEPALQSLLSDLEPFLTPVAEVACA